ncbi:MAG: SMP-30/gluconolactonase/LRE family protein [Polyangiaceae bacterium]
MFFRFPLHVPRCRRFPLLALRGALLCVPVVALACGESAESSSGSSGPSSTSSTTSSSSSTSSGGVDGGSSSGGNDAAPDAPVTYPDPIAGIGAPSLVSGGFVFTEGPLWLPASNKLLFSDVQGNKMYELPAGGTTASTFRDPSNRANGHALAPGGVFYSCEHGTGSGGRLTKTLANGTVEPVVSMFGGANLNSPNDVIVRGDGNVYFTDPNYGGNTQPKQNVFRLAPGTNVPLVVDDTLSKPNGIALSPDQNTLYVASYAGNFVKKYPLDAAGVPGAGTMFLQNVASPDGIAVDDAGNLYAAVNAGVAVYRRDATLIGTISIPNGKRASNIAFGEADRKTLYITAQTDLYRVKVNVPGPP